MPAYQQAKFAIFATTVFDEFTAAALIGEFILMELSKGFSLNNFSRERFGKERIKNLAQSLMIASNLCSALIAYTRLLRRLHLAQDFAAEWMKRITLTGPRGRIQKNLFVRGIRVPAVVSLSKEFERVIMEIWAAQAYMRPACEYAETC